MKLWALEHHHIPTPWSGAPPWALELRAMLGAIICNQETLMTAIDDLKAAITDLVNEAITDLETVIAKLATIPPDDTVAVQALTQQAKDTTAKLRADMAALAAPAATS